MSRRRVEITAVERIDQARVATDRHRLPIPGGFVTQRGRFFSGQDAVL